MSVARLLWSPPARFADRPTDRRVTLLELFFDLVFVVVISHPDGASRPIPHGRASRNSCSSFTRSGRRGSTGRRPRTVADADPVVSVITPPAWKTLPSWAVIGTEDRIIPPAAQHRMAERTGATITEVDASHVSMVSHPHVSVAAILAAVAAVG
jgi:pimeloyl-ACP methyl ester carboxylesterase